MGSLPQLSARGTLYNNSVCGNWLRPKGVAKVSGIFEGSDFNIKSIYERLGKGAKRNDQETKCRENILFFFYLFIQFKKRKKERDSAFKAV